MSDAMYYEDWLSEMVERSEDKAYVTLDSKTVMGIADYLRRSRENKPVVLCKDCKHGEMRKNCYGDDVVDCSNPNSPVRGDYTFTAWPDWFCADGERKDNKHEAD